MDDPQKPDSTAPLGPEDTPEDTRTDDAGFGRGRARLGAVIAVLAAVAFIAWAVIGGRGGDSPSTTTTEATGTGPVAVSAGGLATLTAALNQPIYWLGQKPNTLYEITQTADGKVYIRYLPAGVDAGDRRPLTTVGTYPVADAFSATEAASKGQGSVAIPVGGGGVGFHGRNNPTSAYAAYPGSDYQVEVFDPTPGEARRLVGSGRVTQVPGATAPTPATAMSPAGLKSAATRLSQPIYWAGPETDATYELSQTSEGRVFVRYLPPGVAVGDPKPFRTIATYPLTSAFAVTRALGKNPNTATVKLDDGGIAVYDKATRTSVYVAYPGSDYQIEVFDPTAGNAPELVRSGTIVAVG